eukprot:2006244-Prymnesium_polylepis.1
MQEFFAQGDREAALGLPFSMNCDRHTVSVAKCQVAALRRVRRVLAGAQGHGARQPRRQPRPLQGAGRGLSPVLRRAAIVRRPSAPVARLEASVSVSDSRLSRAGSAGAAACLWCACARAHVCACVSVCARVCVQCVRSQTSWECPSLRSAWCCARAETEPSQLDAEYRPAPPAT